MTGFGWTSWCRCQCSKCSLRGGSITLLLLLCLSLSLSLSYSIFVCLFLYHSLTPSLSLSPTLLLLLCPSLTSSLVISIDLFQSHMELCTLLFFISWWFTSTRTTMPCLFHFRILPAYSNSCYLYVLWQFVSYCFHCLLIWIHRSIPLISLLHLVFQFYFWYQHFKNYDVLLNCTHFYYTFVTLCDHVHVHIRM